MVPKEAKRHRDKDRTDEREEVHSAGRFGNLAMRCRCGDLRKKHAAPAQRVNA